MRRRYFNQEEEEEGNYFTGIYKYSPQPADQSTIVKFFDTRNDFTPNISRMTIDGVDVPISNEYDFKDDQPHRVRVYFLKKNDYMQRNV